MSETERLGRHVNTTYGGELGAAWTDWQERHDAALLAGLHLRSDDGVREALRQELFRCNHIKAALLLHDSFGPDRAYPESEAVRTVIWEIAEARLGPDEAGRVVREACVEHHAEVCPSCGTGVELAAWNEVPPEWQRRVEAARQARG